MEARDARRRAARALYEQNDLAGARAAYLGLIADAADDAVVLVDAGTFFVKTGALAAARTVFERAVACAPASGDAQRGLATVRFAANEYEGARAAYAAALALDPSDLDAHVGISYALVRLDRDAEAAAHRRRGFAGRSVVTAPYRGTARPIDVLLLVAAAGGTIYTDGFLDDTVFRVTTLVADAEDPNSPPLPQRDVVLNALADADRVAPALSAMERRFGDDPRVVNAPARVLATARAANARRLAALPGVVAPRTVEVARASLARSGAAALTLRGFAFPLLLRAPGHQTGRHFVRVETAGDLAAAVDALPGDTLLAIEALDVRSSDGAYRKYRMMIVDGALYPLHAAVSDAWKVHFFTARTDVAAYRAEDARFLADPLDVLGAPALRALEAVRDTLGLDYAGIDFALDRAGRVVVFEANASMIVLPPGPDPMWDYRRAATARVLDAARALVRARAGGDA